MKKERGLVNKHKAPEVCPTSGAFILSSICLPRSGKEGTEFAVSVCRHEDLFNSLYAF